MISRSAKCSCITFLFFLLDKPRNYRLNFFFRLIIHRLFKILFTVVTSLFQFWYTDFHRKIFQILIWIYERKPSLDLFPDLTVKNSARIPVFQSFFLHFPLCLFHNLIFCKILCCDLRHHKFRRIPIQWIHPVHKYSIFMEKWRHTPVPCKRWKYIIPVSFSTHTQSQRKQLFFTVP